MFFEFNDTNSVYKPKQNNLIFPLLKNLTILSHLEIFKKETVLACRAFPILNLIMVLQASYNP